MLISVFFFRQLLLWGACPWFDYFGISGYNCKSVEHGKRRLFGNSTGPSKSCEMCGSDRSLCCFLCEWRVHNDLEHNTGEVVHALGRTCIAWVIKLRCSLALGVLNTCIMWRWSWVNLYLRVIYSKWPGIWAYLCWNKGTIDYISPSFLETFQVSKSTKPGMPYSIVTHFGCCENT